MSRDKNPTVRPRYTWLGLLVGLAGAVLIGIGVSLQSWTWAIVGIVVLVVGGALAMRGGVMSDAHQMGIGEELKEAVHGETREGIKPGAMVQDPKVKRTSVEMDEVRHAATAGSHQAPHPPFANMGAILAVLVGVFLMVAQWGLYPIGHQPQTNANWSMGFAILATAGGLRILFGEPGRHKLSVAFILLCGVGLLLRAFLATHVIAGTAISEGVCGAVLLLGGLIAMVSPATELEQLPTQREPDRLPDVLPSHAGAPSHRAG